MTTSALSILLLLSLTAPCNAGAKDDYETNRIKYLITVESILQGMDPRISLAVVAIESAFNPRAVGPVGELGLFQLRVRRFSEKYFRPELNIREGLKRLNYWKHHCPLQEGMTWVICYNSGYRKPKYPYLHPYYKKFKEAYNGQQ